MGKRKLRKLKENEYTNENQENNNNLNIKQNNQSKKITDFVNTNAESAPLAESIENSKNKYITSEKIHLKQENLNKMLSNHLNNNPSEMNLYQNKKEKLENVKEIKTDKINNIKNSKINNDNDIQILNEHKENLSIKDKLSQADFNIKYKIFDELNLDVEDRIKNQYFEKDFFSNSSKANEKNKNDSIAEENNNQETLNFDDIIFSKKDLILHNLEIKRYQSEKFKFEAHKFFQNQDKKHNPSLLKMNEHEQQNEISSKFEEKNCQNFKINSDDLNKNQVHNPHSNDVNMEINDEKKITDENVIAYKKKKVKKIILLLIILLILALIIFFIVWFSLSSKKRDYPKNGISSSNAPITYDRKADFIPTKQTTLRIPFTKDENLFQFLSKFKISCENTKEILNSISFKIDSERGDYFYEYTCINKTDWKISFPDYEINTIFTDIKNNNFTHYSEYLSKQEIKCNNDDAIVGFKLNYDQLLNRINYSMNCVPVKYKSNNTNNNTSKNKPIKIKCEKYSTEEKAGADEIESFLGLKTERSEIEYLNGFKLNFKINGKFNIINFDIYECFKTN